MATEISVIDNIDPIAVYSGQLDDILSKLAAELRDGLQDISTEKGRKEIASRAYKAARCKTKLDELGKNLGEEYRKRLEAINSDRKKAKEFMENLQADIRKPLDEYEACEAARIDQHETALQLMGELMFVNGMTLNIDNQKTSDIDQRVLRLREIYNRQWDEFAIRADSVFGQSLEKLTKLKFDIEKHEADQTELSRLRTEQAERERIEQERLQKEREERIAAEAAETARREAEEKADANAKAESKRVAQELEVQRLAKEKAERDAAEARERARKSEENRIASEQRQEIERIEAIAKAERESIAAQERAIQEERDRVAKEAEVQRIAEEKRQADVEHRKKINNEILTAMLKFDFILGDVQAKKIIEIIAKGQVPHMKITY